jgi:hypothetical protein
VSGGVACPHFDGKPVKMSEYQYYEFLAIDRPLSSSQIDEVREFSSRAEIGPTSFSNEYHWGNFKGDPVHFLTHYFDVMIYTANWGTRQFMFRVPRDVVDRTIIEKFCTEQSVNVTPAGKWLIIDLCLEPEDGGGDYKESSGGWMASLIGIRAEVLSGDFRPLYLAWLLDLQNEVIGDDEPQPPVPPGLEKLSAAQTALIAYLGIDRHLVMIAARESPPSDAPAMDLATALSKVPTGEKDRWLLELMETDAPHASLRLRSKLMAMMPKPSAAGRASPPKSAGELRETWKRLEREREERLRAAAEAKRKKDAAEAAAVRERQLDELSRKMPGAWRNVDQLIGMKSQEGYRQAIAILKDLRAVEDRPGGNLQGFKQRLITLMEANHRKGSLIAMLKAAGVA